MPSALGLQLFPCLYFPWAGFPLSKAVSGKPPSQPLQACPLLASSQSLSPTGVALPNTD